MNAPLLTHPAERSYDERLASVTKELPKLEAIIAELFPGPIVVEVDEDPEIAGKRYYVFSVEARERVPDFSERYRRWFERAGELLGFDFELACLLVNAIE